MKKTKKFKMLLVGLLVLILAFSCVGCDKKESKKDDESIYKTTIDGLSKDSHYAYVDLGLKHKVLMVTTDSYYDNGDGTMVSISPDVYYICDGKAKKLGSLEGQSTAYPVAYDKTGIYVAWEHSSEKYTIDEKTCELVQSEGVYEEFDSDENATYTKLENGEKVPAEKQDFDSYLEAYNASTFVDFNDGVTK